MRARRLLFAVLIASGCASSDELPVGAELRLGTGLTEFEPFGDGDSLELVRGVQGGFHVLGAVELVGFDPGGYSLRYWALDTSGDRLSYPSGVVLTPGRLVETDRGWVRSGDRVIFDIDHAEEIIGVEVLLEARLLEGEVELLFDSRRALVVDEVSDR